MKDPEIKIVIFALVLIAGVGLLVGYVIGYGRGMEWYKNMSARVECELEHSSTPYYEIPGECLRYFNIDQSVVRPANKDFDLKQN